jgi:hypothetical protein
MSVIVVQGNNNYPSIVTPVVSSIDEIAQILQQTYKIVDRTLIPADMIYNSAWIYDDSMENGINYDISKVREVHINLWRKARKPLLDALDVQFMRAVENMDTDTILDIKTKKQTLRDVTLTDMSSLTTLDQITMVWPSCLGDRPANLNTI